MSSIAPQLGLVVRKHRLAAGLSQEALADRARLHRTYVSLLERGLRNPSIDVLMVLADVLKVEASRLLAEAEDEMSRQDGATC